VSITIKDIARILNVSHTTVSRSLNDSPLISQETKDRVKEVAKKYKYSPNVTARRLVLSRSYNIGLFISTLSRGTTANFFLQTVRGVNEVVKGKYTVTVESVADLEDFHHIKSRNFDGILLMSQSPNDDTFIGQVLNEGIPLVVMNREITDFKVTTVLSEDLLGSYLATKYIIEQGHKNIAIIEGKRDFRTAFKRKQGFLKAHLDAGLKFDESLAFVGAYDLESGYNAMQNILDLENRPTAVFCSNDDMAFGAIKAIREVGLVVPDDISIVGFDNMDYTQFLTPALTTVQRPVEEMSRHGAEILLEKIEGSYNSDLEEIHLDSKLVIRDSVKKIN